MCNRYTIRGTNKELAQCFQSTIPTDFEFPGDDILPGYIAPGLLRNLDGERELVPMQFGLAKILAADPFNRKWPNNNSRIKKIGGWPWKISIKAHRCILPVSEFREPCYWGETAGTEVHFKPWGEQGEGSRGHRTVKAISKLLQVLNRKGMLNDDDINDILGHAADSL